MGKPKEWNAKLLIINNNNNNNNNKYFNMLFEILKSEEEHEATSEYPQDWIGFHH